MCARRRFRSVQTDSGEQTLYTRAMKARDGVAAAAVAMMTVGCGSPHMPATTAPTTVDVPSDLSGSWSGTGNDPQGAVTFTWTLRQTGSALSGAASMSSVNPNDGSCGSCHKQKTGTIAGSVAGSAVTLTLDFPEGGTDITPLCGLRLTAAAGDVTSQRIAATYTGTTSCEGPIEGGTLVMTR
jgi:hypothetical protein